jgi:hypothetical protein
MIRTSDCFENNSRHISRTGMHKSRANLICTVTNTSGSSFRNNLPVNFELANGGSVRGFIGPEPALGASRRDTQQRLNRWLINQHRARSLDLGSTQR